MRQLQPVLWTKGTLLSPQHLQMQDRFLEDSLQFRLETLAYCPYGFRQLQLDRDVLSTNGLCAIATASGIFPDGLLFDIPGADPAPPPRPIADFFPPGGSSMDVYLAVPHYREKGINISIPGTTADTRYIADYSMVRDEVKANVEKPIQIAKKGFRFLFEGESRQGYTALRLARIRKTAAGQYQIDEQFVPPLLDIRASDLLMTIARRLVENLAAKSTELAALRRHKNQSLADFTSSDIASFWLLYTINVHFPEFRHLFEVKGGHPEQLFSVMLALAGALTTFSPDLHPRDLPVYDHEDLAACFRELDEKLRILLDTVVKKNYVSLALRQVQPCIYAASLADERYFANTRMYLALRADMDQGELIGRAPKMVTVSSAGQIDQLVRLALSGLQMTHVQRPPSALPVKLHYEYFALNQAGESWQSIVRSRNLAAYVPAEFIGAEAELVILLPQPL